MSDFEPPITRLSDIGPVIQELQARVSALEAAVMGLSAWKALMSLGESPRSVAWKQAPRSPDSPTRLDVQGPEDE